MVTLRMLTTIVTWCWVVAGVVGVAGGQRAPCYQCEMYRETHPHSHPYTAVRTHCVYPCNCGPIPSCGPGTPIIQDGCRCCWQCARRAGEPCDGVYLCDSSKSLACRYSTTADAVGVCQEVYQAKCVVNDTTYEHGEMFSLDCRTQCTCQNGTYACVSLCPGESLPPSDQCHNPHLVSVPGQCCREWMCDAAPDKMVGPPVCDRQSGHWSECSSKTCGVGVSVRWSTDNTHCRPINQTRLCQVRACRKEGQEDELSLIPSNKEVTKKHHIRRGHTCKATLRHMQSVRLRAGWCISEKRYRPKMCADCPGRCCKIHASTTITVAFMCPLHANTDLLATTRRHRVTDPREYDAYKTSPHDLHYRIGTQDFQYRSDTQDLSSYDISDDGGPQPPSFDSVLKNPEPVRDFRDIDIGYDDVNEDFHNRVKKSNQYDDEINNYPNELGDYSQNDLNRSDNLLEDTPPFEIDNLTVEDDIEFNQIKNDNYETVHHQVQWILRCKCESTCDNQSDPDPQGQPQPPT